MSYSKVFLCTLKRVLGIVKPPQTKLKNIGKDKNISCMLKCL